MKYAVAFFLLGTSVGFAQFDSGNNKVNIPPAEIKTSPEKPVTKPFELPPSIKDPNTSPPSSILKKENEISLTKKNEFANPGKKVEEKLNKRGDGQQLKMFRRNQHLGDFKTSAAFVKVNYRDFGQVDGDMIRVLVNDKVVKPQVILEGRFQGFDITLEPGFNKIDFEALQEGIYSPNTAEFQLFDDKGELISANQWDLATGFKATIVVVKE